MCPNTSAFTASDPKSQEAPFGWIQEECTPKLYPAARGEYVKDVVAEMERLNVTAVVFGDPTGVQRWRDAAPGRVIPGTSFTAGIQPGARVALEELRRRFTTGGSGRANVAMPRYRASMGDPLLLEELLARHPKLRVQVMHAGYPMIDNVLALLQASSHVHVDVAGLIWSYPLKEVNRHIERLVDAGFADRVMFGTDQLGWPGLMAYSISVIQNADYLTPQQKRDILYHNAARFLRLDASPQN